MFEIKVSQEIKNTCPVFAGAAVYAAVKNTALLRWTLERNKYFHRRLDYHHPNGRH